MNITFTPLTRAHFPLLLTWLSAPHVHAWWDKDVTWTSQIIEEKYDNYVTGHVTPAGTYHAIHAYILLVNNIPIGYIQYYNHHNFTRTHEIANLPNPLAAFDMYIGEKPLIGKGIGTAALKLFLTTYVDPKYEYSFADPDPKNLAAVRTYEKAGFVVKSDGSHTYMLRQRP